MCRDVRARSWPRGQRLRLQMARCYLSRRETLPEGSLFSRRHRRPACLPFPHFISPLIFFSIQLHIHLWLFSSFQNARARARAASSSFPRSEARFSVVPRRAMTPKHARMAGHTHVEEVSSSVVAIRRRQQPAVLRSLGQLKPARP